MFSKVKFGNQIDIRRLGFGPRHGAVQAQMNNAGGFQLRLMLAQCGDDMLPVYTGQSHI